MAFSRHRRNMFENSTQILSAMKAVSLSALLAWGCALSNEIPEHAHGLQEERLAVELEGGGVQVGVLSMRLGHTTPSRLAVLLPGHPSVVRPVMRDGIMAESKLTGNFLIRARRHLIQEDIATLLVDCVSSREEICDSAYQASRERQQHVDQLIAAARQRLPSIQQVWLVGTSMGTISSSFMPIHNPTGYAGAIHTAGITAPLARGSYTELQSFDYRKIPIFQVFIHHHDDPCPITPYSGAVEISSQFQIPLVTVRGGSGFQGSPCQAYTQHGFRGKEGAVMHTIAQIIRTGTVPHLVID